MTTMICKAHQEGRCQRIGGCYDSGQHHIHHNEKDTCKIGGCEWSDTGVESYCIPVPEETTMEYELLKPVSIKALEDAGACERELHRFAFLLMKNFPESCNSYLDGLNLPAVLTVATQCAGGIEFLLKNDFIRPKEPELKPCPFCGSCSSHTRPTQGNSWVEVFCSVCGGKGASWNTSREAIEAWNKRV